MSITTPPLGREVGVGQPLAEGGEERVSRVVPEKRHGPVGIAVRICVGVETLEADDEVLEQPVIDMSTGVGSLEVLRGAAVVGVEGDVAGRASVCAGKLGDGAGAGVIVGFPRSARPSPPEATIAARGRG